MEENAEKLTSIALKISTKEKLEALKVHPRQSFDDVVLKLLEEVG